MKRYWIGLLAIACLAVALAYALPASTEKTVALIPAVVVHEPLTVGGGASIPIGPYFIRVHQHHLWCKQPVTVAKRGIHGVWRQRFLKCEMAIGPVSVYGVTPRATATRPVPKATSTPTSFPSLPATNIPVPPTPAPIATATPWWVNIPTSTPIPVPTLAPPSSPVQYELSLMNQSRASLGLPPYSLNSTESAGTATCPGSQGHADHMAQAGVISHDQFPADICVAVRTAGENVGEAGGYGVQGALDIINQQMMAETPFSYGCTGSHRCNIMQPNFNQVGIGITTINGTTYMAVDFLG